MQPRTLLLLLLRLAALAALRGLAAGAPGQGEAGGLPSVSICVAIKDQAVDVREWIYYHRAIGAACRLVSLPPAPSLPLHHPALRLSRAPLPLLPCRRVQVLYLGHGQQAAAAGALARAEA